MLAMLRCFRLGMQMNGQQNSYNYNNYYRKVNSAVIA